jgi:non-heme chloroperoxidase
MNQKLYLCFLAILFALSAEAKEKALWKDLYVKVGDIKIHYLEAGSGERNLIFIPGWTMPAEVWQEQIPYFAAREFHVFAYDPRSQGETTKTDISNTIHQQAADLHAFLQALKIEHSYLVGWDSAVAVLLDYLSSPEAIRPEGLVFVDGSPTALKTEDCPGNTTIKQARTFILDFQEKRAKAAETYVHSLFKLNNSQILHKELTDASIKTPLSAAFALFFDLFTGDWRLGLARVPVPSLIVTTVENRRLGEYMQAKTPRSKLEVIEDAGHAIFLDKPQAFNQILESFLGKH